MKQWYLTKLVFQVISGEGRHEAQFDEQLRLIMAEDVQEAMAKAQAVGQEEDTLFVNSDDETVQWKFTDVAGLYPLGALTDGMEIYSSTTEPADARRYIQEIHLRAADILNAVIPTRFATAV